MYHIEDKITKITDIAQITVGCGPVMADNSFPHTEITKTEQAAAYAKVLDATAYLNLAVSGGGAGYTGNYQLFPDTETTSDSAFFGAATKFGLLWFDMSATVATYGADSITWQYYNGSAWTALTIKYDGTSTAAGKIAGERPFMRDGYILFDIPSDWATVEVDSQSAYWIRANVNATQITQIPLTDSHEQYTCTFTGTTVPFKGTISTGRFSFETTSATNADTKVMLVNITQGTSSAEKTITKGKLDVTISDFALAVNADDKIAFVCTDEDGTTEYAGGVCELKITKSL